MRKSEDFVDLPEAPAIPSMMTKTDQKKEEQKSNRLEDLSVTELKAWGFDLQTSMAINQQRLNAVINELSRRGI